MFVSVVTLFMEVIRRELVAVLVIPVTDFITFKDKAVALMATNLTAMRWVGDIH